MDLFWALLIIAVLVVLLFAVIPSFVEKQTARTSHGKPPRHVGGVQAVAQPDATQNAAMDRAMLDSHYSPAREVVPEDHPRKAVGDCPYSRPPATDLPMRDLPMCVAQNSTTMKLV